MLKIIRSSIFIVSLLLALLVGVKFSESIKMAISNKEEEKINISVPKKEDIKTDLSPLRNKEEKSIELIKNVPNVPSKNTMDLKNPTEIMDNGSNMEIPTRILDNKMEKPQIPGVPMIDTIIEQEELPKNIIDSKEM